MTAVHLVGLLLRHKLNRPGFGHPVCAIDSSDQWTAPKSLQAKAKNHLHDIWQAETKAEANAAFDFFIEIFGLKYDKTVAKLAKDRKVLLTFYDYIRPTRHPL